MLASLDEDVEIEEEWAAETERRMADIEGGVVQITLRDFVEYKNGDVSLVVNKRKSKE